MEDGLDLGAATGVEQMHKTVIEIADRAVATNQIGYLEAAIGTGYALFDLYRRAGHSEEGALSIMRSSVDIMAAALENQRDAPL